MGIFQNRILLANRRLFGVLAGVIVGLMLIGILNHPYFSSLHAAGEMLPGHENLECRECHINAPGSFRQQLQARMQYLLDNREEDISIGHNPVGNNDCLACHARSNDHHPVFRFFEPRYKEVREKIQPQFCSTCHAEHQGRRVSIASDFCKECHGRLVIQNDPLDVSHQQLVKEKRWRSCLTCHDFHGNHLRKVPLVAPTDMTQAIIQQYFQSGTSPYSDRKQFKAKESRYVDEK